MAFGDIVQTVITENGDGTEDPASLSFGSTPTIGNLIILVMGCGDGPLAPSTAGLLEAVENHDTGQDDACSINYRVVQSGDGVAWAVDLPSSDQYVGVLMEIEGPWEASPLDQTGTAAAADSQSTETVTAAGTTSQADEFVVAAVQYRALSGVGNVNDVSSWSDSFVERGESENNEQSGVPTLKGINVATKLLTATGTPSTTATYATTAGRSFGLMATFKKAAGGGGRTTKNTRSFPLGFAAGMGHRNNWIH